MKKFNHLIVLLIVLILSLGLILNFSQVVSLIRVILNSFTPVIVAAVLAFILNVPMKSLEQLLEKNAFFKKRKRIFAISFVFLLLLMIIVSIITIIVPILASSITGSVSVISTGGAQVIDFLQNEGIISFSIGDQWIERLDDEALIRELSQYLSVFVSGILGSMSTLVSNTFTVAIALFMTISMLQSKEHLQKMTTQLLHALFSKKVVKDICYIGRVTVETYERFLKSQMVEAIVIGVMTTLTFALFQIPYALTAGILAGVLSFIPYLGTFTACLISVLLVFERDPWLALLAFICFQLVQFIEGNFIYPKLVGQSIGIPELFALIAAVVGGSLFGFLGMIFFTPIVAVLYRLIKEWVYSRLQNSEIL